MWRKPRSNPRMIQTCLKRTLTNWRNGLMWSAQNMEFSWWQTRGVVKGLGQHWRYFLLQSLVLVASMDDHSLFNLLICNLTELLVLFLPMSYLGFSSHYPPHLTCHTNSHSVKIPMPPSPPQKGIVCNKHVLLCARMPTECMAIIYGHSIWNC